MTPFAQRAWIIGVITVLVINCLISIYTIYVIIREKYWPIWIITILFFIIGSFGAFTEFQRGSVVAWLFPLLCGHCGIIMTHQIGINHYSI